MMVVIAREGTGTQAVSLGRVADSTMISRRYLEQLAMALKKAALLRSVAGRKGGYLLARPAREIRIGEIIEASIGPLSIVECVDKPDDCLKTDFCECRLFYMLISKRLSQVFNEYSLADMTDRNWTKEISRELARKEPRTGSRPSAGAS